MGAREKLKTESAKNVILRQTSEKEVEKNKANKTAQNRKIRSRLKCKNHNIIKQKQITLNEQINTYTEALAKDLNCAAFPGLNPLR